jgi:hypothetical protein
MEKYEDVSNIKFSKFMSPHTSNIEVGLVNLIEVAELLRRKKMLTEASYSEVFFSAAKQYIG